MSSYKAVECAICKEHMRCDDIYYTPCSHSFNLRCITEWLKNSSTCPQCRSIVYPHELRRMYLNLSDTTMYPDQTLRLIYLNRITKLNTEIGQQEKKILEYKSLLEKQTSELSNANKEIGILKERLNPPNCSTPVTRASSQGIANKTAETVDNDKLVSMIGTLKSKMKINVAAEHQKYRDTKKKLQHEREKLAQLKEELSIAKADNKSNQEKIKELEKIVQKPTTSANQTSPAVQGDSIASRTRSRTLR